MQFENGNISKTDTESIFSELLSIYKDEYSIPAKAFENYHVKKGLREPDGTGVMAGITKIGNAHGYIISEGEKIPIDGVLHYRGYNVADFVSSVAADGRYGFEECAYLLFFGELPTQKQLDRFDALLDAYRFLPPRFTEDIIMKAPSRSIMNKISQGVLALYAYDDNPDDTSIENMLRQSMELLARIPIIAAQSYAVYRSAFCGANLNINNPKNNRTTAQNFLRILRPDGSYTEEEAHLLDLCLIIHAEHGGGNNSTFSCRVLSSSGTDTYSAISAALGSLKGPKHGGANIKVQEMFDCIKANVKNTSDDGEVADFLRKILAGEAGDGSGLVYGMGHPIYTLSDPRAVMLKKYAANLAEERGYGDDFRLLETIERLTPELFAECKGLSRPMCANVDLYSGLVYRMLDIPTEMYTPLFAIARVAGWCAHRMEEIITSKKIIRPAYKCIMKDKKYIPINKRREG